MTCPDCNQEMAKDVGGISGPSQAIQFNTHVCDCGGVHKAFMDDGRDLLQFWREHPNQPPPNCKLVGPPTDEHKQSARIRQQERERMAMNRAKAVAPGGAPVTIARLNRAGLVLNVEVCDADWFAQHGQGCIISTADNPAVVGGDYVDGYFYAPQPYPSWTRSKGAWVPPVARPHDGKRYEWDEQKRDWVALV